MALCCLCPVAKFGPIQLFLVLFDEMLICRVELPIGCRLNALARI